MSNKGVIPADDMVAKLKAAADTRSNDDFLIVARTDAIAVEGLDAALERGHAYADAGADILFVEAPVNDAQMQSIPEALPQCPHLANMAPRTPLYSPEQLTGFGYKLVVHPGLFLSAMLQGGRDEAAYLRENGVPKDPGGWRTHFDEINSFLGKDEYQ